MSSKHAREYITSNKLSHSLTDSDLFFIILIMILGVITKIIRISEKIKARTILGELMLTFMMAIFLYFLGLYEGLTNIQIMLIAIPSSLGNARIMQYLVNILQTNKSNKAK